jgi:hypothetical protein
VNVGHLGPQSTGKRVVGNSSTAKSEQHGRCDPANGGYKCVTERVRLRARIRVSKGIDYSLVIEGRDDG